MSQSYPFTKVVNSERLHVDIVDSSIVTTLEGVDVNGTDDVNVVFVSAISGADETTLNGIVASQVDVPMPSEMGGLVVGLTLSNNTTTPDSKVDISTGRVRRRGGPFSVNSVLTVDIDTNGANGLDTGTVQADTWYAVFALSDQEGIITPAGIFSLNLAPEMPSGYCCYRRLGWVKTDATSDIMGFQERWNGNTRRFFWDVVLADTRVLENGSAATFTAVSLSAYVPQTSCCVVLNVDFKTGAGGDGGDDVKFKVTGSSFAIVELSSGKTSGKKTKMYLEIPTDTSQSIDYKVTDGVNNKAGVSVRGWDDDL